LLYYYIKINTNCKIKQDFTIFVYKKQNNIEWKGSADPLEKETQKLYIINITLRFTDVPGSAGEKFGIWIRVFFR